MVAGLLAVIIRRGIRRILEVLIQIARKNKFGEFSGFSVIHTGKCSGEMNSVTGQIIINVERAAVMADYCIPLLREQDICRTYGTDAADLLDFAPVLVHRHQTGNPVVGCGVHQLIDNVRLGKAVVRKRALIIVNHDSDRSLVLDVFADRKSGQLARIHSFGNGVAGGSFLCLCLGGRALRALLTYTLVNRDCLYKRRFL